MVRASAALLGAALAVTKIANDMRWLASGPRCGLRALPVEGASAESCPRVDGQGSHPPPNARNNAT